MTWLLVALLTVLYIVLALRLASWLGGLLRDATLPADEPVRCTCRRFGFPSPLCRIHGEKAA